jgi:predicted metal-dependent hydrolase
VIRENEDLEGALREYRRLLEAGEYFEAHEVLEAAWHVLRRLDDPLRSPVKGLINAAIAFEHLKRGRPKARRVAARALEAYRRRCRGDESPEIAASCRLVERMIGERRFI